MLGYHCDVLGVDQLGHDWPREECTHYQMEKKTAGEAVLVHGKIDDVGTYLYKEEVRRLQRIPRSRLDSFIREPWLHRRQPPMLLGCHPPNDETRAKSCLQGRSQEDPMDRPYCRGHQLSLRGER